MKILIAYQPMRLHTHDKVSDILPFPNFFVKSVSDRLEAISLGATLEMAVDPDKAYSYVFHLIDGTEELVDIRESCCEGNLDGEVQKEVERRESILVEYHRSI